MYELQSLVKRHMLRFLRGTMDDVFIKVIGGNHNV